MTVTMRAYARAVRPLIDSVLETAGDAVPAAAELVYAALRAGGVAHAFGSGHSEAFAMELAGRAGGLVPVNRLTIRDAVRQYAGTREGLDVRVLERDPAVATGVFRLAAPAPADVFVIASHSGVNGSVVELARLAVDHGHPLVAVTSVAHSARAPSRHPSGRRLAELADVVLDNGAPYGDTLLPMPGGAGAVGAVSSITAALVAQLLTIEVVRRFLDDAVVPPTYRSVNVPGGDEHNRRLEEQYAGRIRRRL